MDSTNKFTIFQTADFEEELENIIYYFRKKLKEPIIAEKFYNDVINKILSLCFMPERYMKIDISKDKHRNIRKLPIKDYLIIYEVNKNNRTSFYLTYFSLHSKLF